MAELDTMVAAVRGPPEISLEPMLLLLDTVVDDDDDEDEVTVCDDVVGAFSAMTEA